MKKTFGFLAAAALFVAFAASNASAQSLNIFTPTTDTQAPKSVYVEGDTIDNLRSDPTGWQYGLVRGVYGLNDNMELGANVMVSRGGGYTNPVEFQPNFKWRWFDQKEANGGHFAIASGVQDFTVIANHNSPAANNFGEFYTVASYRFLSDTGPRITGGGWGLVNRTGDTGSKAGFLGGFELPLSNLSKSNLASKLTWQTDYMSGDQNHGGFSSLSTGAAYSITPTVTALFGYTWANKNPGGEPGFGTNNNGFFLFIGKTWSWGAPPAPASN